MSFPRNFVQKRKRGLTIPHRERSRAFTLEHGQFNTKHFTRGRGSSYTDCRTFRSCYQVVAGSSPAIAANSVLPIVLSAATELASHANILLARHALLPLGRRDYVTNQKNVCVGGYYGACYVVRLPASSCRQFPKTWQQRKRQNKRLIKLGQRPVVILFWFSFNLRTVFEIGSRL